MLKDIHGTLLKKKKVRAQHGGERVMNRKHSSVGRLHACTFTNKCQGSFLPCQQDPSGGFLHLCHLPTTPSSS